MSKLNNRVPGLRIKRFFCRQWKIWVYLNVSSCAFSAYKCLCWHSCTDCTGRVVLLYESGCAFSAYLPKTGRQQQDMLNEHFVTGQYWNLRDHLLPHWNSHTLSTWMASHVCACIGDDGPTRHWWQTPCHNQCICVVGCLDKRQKQMFVLCASFCQRPILKDKNQDPISWYSPTLMLVQQPIYWI